MAVGNTLIYLESAKNIIYPFVMSLSVFKFLSVTDSR